MKILYPKLHKVLQYPSRALLNLVLVFFGVYFVSVAGAQGITAAD